MKSALLSFYPVLIISFVFLEGSALHAQDERYLGPVSNTYAITNATIFQGPGRKILHATIVLRDGLIESVGANVSAPPDAVIIRGDSLFVYPGFIDGLSHAGFVQPAEDRQSHKVPNPGDPPPEFAGITPQRDVRDLYNCTDGLVGSLRAAGFTCAHIAPCGEMLPGYAALMQLSCVPGGNPMLVSRSALFSQFKGAPDRLYPGTTMGVMAKWRQLYLQSSLTASYAREYASNHAGRERPESDRVLESFFPVISRETPVLFATEDMLDVDRALELQLEFGFRMILTNVKSGWIDVEKVKRSPVGVFLSLDLPDEVKTDSTKTFVGMTEEEQTRLQDRRMETVRKYESQAGVFHNAGIRFGFATADTKCNSIHKNLLRIVSAGLDQEAVLAALTIDAATILGISDRLGSLDPGKIANVVACDRPYIDEDAKIKYVFIDGQPSQIERDKQKKKGEVEVEGHWTITTKTPDGKTEGTVTFAKKDDGYKGRISGGNLQAPVEFDSVDLKGDKLVFSYTVSYQGQTMRVEVKVQIKGDSFEGTAYAGDVDQFPISGTKNPDKR